MPGLKPRFSGCLLIKLLALLSKRFNKNEQNVLVPHTGHCTGFAVCLRRLKRLIFYSPEDKEQLDWLEGRGRGLLKITLSDLLLNNIPIKAPGIDLSSTTADLSSTTALITPIITWQEQHVGKNKLWQQFLLQVLHMLWSHSHAKTNLNTRFTFFCMLNSETLKSIFFFKKDIFTAFRPQSQTSNLLFLKEGKKNCFLFQCHSLLRASMVYFPPKQTMSC